MGMGRSLRLLARTNWCLILSITLVTPCTIHCDFLSCQPGATKIWWCFTGRVRFLLADNHFFGYPTPVVKHGLLENPPVVVDFPATLDDTRELSWINWAFGETMGDHGRRWETLEVSGVTFSFDAAKPALARIEERSVKRLGSSRGSRSLCQNPRFARRFSERNHPNDTNKRTREESHLHRQVGKVCTRLCKLRHTHRATGPLPL